jgi:hypothetical protein
VARGKERGGIEAEPARAVERQQIGEGPIRFLEEGIQWQSAVDQRDECSVRLGWQGRHRVIVASPGR